MEEVLEASQLAILPPKDAVANLSAPAPPPSMRKPPSKRRKTGTGVGVAAASAAVTAEATGAGGAGRGGGVGGAGAGGGAGGARSSGHHLSTPEGALVRVCAARLDGPVDGARCRHVHHERVGTASACERRDAK